ncbi:hypothetical protein LOK49_LG05G01094 [Camellia lanceoleosa]|uniref:Uncharacterized protein n=1 Tax=Camellia lanceoleosa TaxID=1840588 RepID=A0ACC0HKA2_9ERIC|nr:hypothetical protein LOK49_LG05G01094 [Camellia lanceoleosa]
MNQNLSIDDMVLPEVQLTRMTHSAVGSYLEPESEAIHLVGIEWWIEEIRLNIEAKWQSAGGRPVQATQMAALSSLVLNQEKVRDISGLSSLDQFPIFPNRSSMDVMLWNCRGAGNKVFKRNFRELIRVHRPDVVALFETKVTFSSMGLFFNNLGFTSSTVVDPIGRVGGIWLIWNPTQVSVSAYVATSQVIQATIKRENFKEWILSVVYASPNISRHKLERFRRHSSSHEIPLASCRGF